MPSGTSPDAPPARSRFQSFVDEAAPERAKERIAALRQQMRALGLAAFIVPRSDAFQNEYLPASEERLAWLTGFTGSAGLLIVLADSAALFVDGRYTLQAAQQVDTDVITVLPIAKHKPAQWLAQQLKSGEAVGVNPWLLTHAAARRYRQALEKAGAELRFVLPDPVEEIWRDRPAPPQAEIFPHPLTYAGRTAAEKLEVIRETIAKKGADVALITATDSISWLFNLRSHAIAHNPVVLGFALVPAEATQRPRLFLLAPRFTPQARARVEEVAEVHPLAAIEDALRALGENEQKVLVDAQRSAARLVCLLEEAGAELITAPDPCLLPKACKTEAEQAGMRAAHVRDGVAMVRFLAWLEEAAAEGAVDEIRAALKLEECRVETAQALGEPLFDLSFDTISAAGAHGAIVHYRVTTASNRALMPGELYLVDSGGQYLDGTTDITRTVFIGPPALAPTNAQKRHFTLVLKGMMALSRVRFPQGVTGANLDVLARQFLWAAGLDYDHGTGHGVGCFLNVHEGPQSISLKGKTPFQPGMITSNEPGYYREGHYGIRIENLILCRAPEKAGGESEDGERPMLSFETLTLCPIDRRLIDPALLTEEERRWLDDYHAKVRETLLPHLRELGDVRARAWLERATAPLPKPEMRA